MLFSIYAGVEAEWKNSQNQTCTMEDILQSACNWPYGAGSCLGTHVVDGIAVAVSRYCLEKDLEPEQLEGVWKRAWNWLQNAIRLMRKNQREDGTIQRCWYKEKPYPRISERSAKYPGTSWRKDSPREKQSSIRPAIVWMRFRHCHCFWPKIGNEIQSASYTLAQTVETTGWKSAAISRH